MSWKIVLEKRRPDKQSFGMVCALAEREIDGGAAALAARMQKLCPGNTHGQLPRQYLKTAWAPLHQFCSDPRVEQIRHRRSGTLRHRDARLRLLLAPEDGIQFDRLAMRSMSIGFRPRLFAFVHCFAIGQALFSH
jgi:hypothetical protein